MSCVPAGGAAHKGTPGEQGVPYVHAPSMPQVAEGPLGCVYPAAHATVHVPPVKCSVHPEKSEWVWAGAPQATTDEGRRVREGVLRVGPTGATRRGLAGWRVMGSLCRVPGEAPPRVSLNGGRLGPPHGSGGGGGVMGCDRTRRDRRARTSRAGTGALAVGPGDGGRP